MLNLLPRPEKAPKELIRKVLSPNFPRTDRPAGNRQSVYGDLNRLTSNRSKVLEFSDIFYKRAPLTGLPVLFGLLSPRLRASFHFRFIPSSCNAIMPDNSRLEKSARLDQ